jgi:regulator of nucleoside diphosphate kinase
MLPDIVLTRSDRDRLANIVQALSLRSQSPVADFLDQEISRARVVDPSEMPANVVTMGSHVVYRDEGTGDERAAVLVYPIEEDSLTGRLSILTPLGTALLGLSEGQSIAWTARDGRQRRVSLVSVLFQPEAAGLPDA